MYPGRSGQLWCVPDPRGADARATSWWRCFASEAALIISRANAELQALREEGRGISERLVEHYCELLGYLDPPVDAERPHLKQPIHARHLALRHPSENPPKHPRVDLRPDPRSDLVQGREPRGSQGLVPPRR